MATTSKTPSLRAPLEGQKQIEIEDPDDYLLYLEVILRNIHKRFYSIYDETTEIPDLKVIVPKIRSEVLRGKNLVFSGLVPTQMKLEQSRAYFIAKSLGAEVKPNIDKEITHLVAVNAGTYKVNAAKKSLPLKWSMRIGCGPAPSAGSTWRRSSFHWTARYATRVASHPPIAIVPSTWLTTASVRRSHPRAASSRRSRAATSAKR